MTDFFKSALGGMFGNQTNSMPGNTSEQNNNMFNLHSNPSNDFVGQNIMIGNYKLRIIKQLAEGGFAIVYLAVDLSTGQEYALKRIFSADDASNKAIREEIGYLKKVVNHPNIIHFIAAACEEKENSRTKEFLILTELCKEPIIDHLRVGLSLPNGKAFDADQVLQIFYQICRSVQYLHTQEPCIVHRDLKLENFLVSKNYSIKLCDFGSATTEIYRPDNTWSVNKRNLIEDEIAKQTTPMYRAPEMLDLYNNYKIDTQADIWALGCVLFVLCFNKHPFEDAAKLRIINGKYQIPNNDKEFNEFHDLIRQLLQINPNDRPNIYEVMFHLENMGQARSITFNENLDFLKNTESLPNNNNGPVFNDIPQQNQAPASQAQNHSNNQSGWMGNAASMFKGNSFMSSIKAASNKVIEGVQSMNKGDLDITYMTSRLIVMSCPTEGIESAAFGNNIDQIKEAIEAKHGKTYRIYNLANKTYKKEKFSQVIDLGMQLAGNRAPPISLMCKLCANILKFLNENNNNVCIINCNDGRNISAIAVCSLFMYCNIIKSIDACLNLFSAKRGPINLTTVQYNYLKDTQRLFSSTRNQIAPDLFLSPNECLLSSVVLSGVPLFNRMRNGCTPYIEIFSKDKKIYTNLTDYAQMKKYAARDGQIMIPINCHKFYGDITVMIFHAKSLLGTEKVTSTKICQVQFHTAFISQELIDSRQVVFKKNALDGLDSAEKYPENFRIFFNIELKSNESPIASDEAWANRGQFESSLPKSPQGILFNEPSEMERILQIFDSANKSYSDDSIIPKRSPPPPPREAQYLNINKYSQADNHSDSSRSASPMPEQLEQQQNNHGKSLLLNFDDDDDDSEESTTNQEVSGSTIKHETLNNDFQLLLDLDEEVKPQESMQSAASTKPPESTSLFDDDFFGSTTPAANSNPQPTQATKPTDLDDLFGSLSQPNNSNQTSTNHSKSTFDPFESLMKPSVATTPKTPELNLFNNLNAPQMNRPLSNSKNNSSSNLLANQNKPNSMNGSQMNSNRATPTDPFADLTAFGSNLNSNSTSTSQNNINNIHLHPNKPNTTNINNNSQNTKYGASANYYIPKPATGNMSNNNSNSSSQTQKQTTQSNFNFNMPSSGKSSNGASTAFDDFLPSNFNKSGDKANMTLKDLQREVNAKDTDPNKLKVMEWTDGKKANIRALLCSLHKILWEGETRWKPCGMHQLVSANDVKKMYRQAVLSVHPDKLSDHPELPLARLIFVELNDAWSQFQKEGQKNLI